MNSRNKLGHPRECLCEDGYCRERELINKARYTGEKCCSTRRSAKNGIGRCCGEDNKYLQEGAPIGMVYAPVQEWKDLYDPRTALMAGTLFKELDLGFYPTPCARKENRGCR